MQRYVWLGLGVIAGFLVAGVVGVVVVNIAIPWEDVCAVLGPAQTLAESGSSLLAQLQEWLIKAEGFLATMGSAEEVAEAKSGLAGLIDKAKDVVGEIQDALVDIVVAPLQALIVVAKAVLNSVQDAVDAAQRVVASVDASRCN